MRLEQEAFVTAHQALGSAKASPVMHPQLEHMQLPSTPVEGGMIPAARPMDSPGQVLYHSYDFLPTLGLQLTHLWMNSGKFAKHLNITA